MLPEDCLVIEDPEHGRALYLWSARPSLSSWQLIKRVLTPLQEACRWQRYSRSADDLFRPVKEVSESSGLPSRSSASFARSQASKDSAFELLCLCQKAVAERTLLLHRAVEIGPHQSLARTMPEWQDERPTKTKLMGYLTSDSLIRSGFHKIHEVEPRSCAWT